MEDDPWKRENTPKPIHDYDKCRLTDITRVGLRMEGAEESLAANVPYKPLMTDSHFAEGERYQPIVTVGNTDNEDSLLPGITRR